MSLPTNALPYQTPVVAWLSPDDVGRPELTTDYETGGIGLNDPSAGLLVQPWLYSLTGSTVSAAPAPYTAETPLITVSGITELSGTFDQNMNPAIAYVASGQAYLYWYETVSEMQITTTLASDVRSPFVTMDDKRGPATTINTNDVLLFYIRGTSLYYRQQREQYDTERLLYEGVEADQVILRAGMSRGLRMQVELGPLPSPQPPEPPVVNPDYEGPPPPSPLYEWRFKRAVDDTYLEADFISRLPEDDFVVSCDVTIVTFYGVDATPEAILYGDLELRETLVTKWVTGGVEGNIYLVTFDAISFLGHAVTLHTILAISSPVRTQ